MNCPKSCNPVKFGYLDPTPGVPLGATNTICTNYDPLPPLMVSAKFGQNPATTVQEEDENDKNHEYQLSLGIWTPPQGSPWGLSTPFEQTMIPSPH